MNIKKVVYVAGIVLVVAGFILISRIPYFYFHSETQGKKLLDKVGDQLSTSTVSVNQDPKQIDDNSRNVTLHPDTKENKQENTNSQNSYTYENHPLLGKITISKLNVSAPILEGTDDNVLSVAIGHLSTSVLPGEKGTCILAAHNATWFRHVDILNIGDTFLIQTNKGNLRYRVTNKKIVHIGDEIVNTATSSVILESCYPLDALHLTEYRYLVKADLIDNT